MSRAEHTTGGQEPPEPRRRRVPWLAALLLCLALTLVAPVPVAPVPVATVPMALAGPVDWHEVPATEAGRQWWDSGSLRLSRGGNLSVLSRFQPAAGDSDGNDTDARSRASDLYVMEIDCGQRLYRDTSVNGIPRFGSEWQAAGSDALIDAVIQESCAAGAALLQAA